MITLLTSAALAVTWTVDPGGAGDFTTIAAAVDAASSGDEILVEPGTYTDRLVLRKDLEIRSTQGPGVTAIEDGAELSLILVDGADVTVEGFSISSNGVMRHCVRTRVGSVELRDVVIHDCSAGDGLGGGLRTDVGTSASVFDSVFEDNLAEFTIAARAPHIYARGEYLEVRDTVFRGGFSEGDSGAVFLIGGDNVLVGNTFEDNEATDDGGALFVDGRPTTFPDLTYSAGTRSLLVDDNTFTGNIAGDKGGAIFLIEVDDYTLTRNRLCGNTVPDRGAGLYIETASSTGDILDNLFLENHSTTADGGGAFVLGGHGVFENNDFVGNTAGDRGDQVSVRLATITFTHNLVAYSPSSYGYYQLDGVTVDALDYNGWYDNQPADHYLSSSPGPGAVFGDPLPTALSLDGDCSNDDLTRLPGSPMVDAGDPARTDLDGSPIDIGVRWGAAAPPGDTGDTGTPATDTGTTGADTADTGTPGTGTGTDDTDTDTDDPGTPGDTADTGLGTDDAGQDASGDDKAGDGGGCGCDTAGPTGSLAALGWTLLVSSIRRRRSARCSR